MRMWIGVALLLVAAGCGQEPPANDPARLAAQLGDPDDGVRLASRLRLMRLGKPAVPYLLRALHEDNPEARYEAAAALAGMRDLPPEAVPELVEAVYDLEPRVRLNVLQALGKLGARARQAIPVVRRALSDPDVRVRRQAAGALDLILIDEPPASPTS